MALAKRITSAKGAEPSVEPMIPPTMTGTLAMAMAGRTLPSRISSNIRTPRTPVEYVSRWG